MKFLGSSFILFLAVFFSGCATLRVSSISEVSGCVEALDLPVGDHCVHAELHEFRGGILLAPGAYVMKDRQLLKDSLCFQFFAQTGARVAVKVRDSDRVLVAGSVYVVAGEASTNLVVHHQRHKRGDAGERYNCERPLADTE